MDLSTFLGNTIINHLLRNQAYVPPATVYASVHTGNPGLTGANEAVGGSYARQAVTLSASTVKTTSSTNTLTFAGMPAGTFSYVGLWDSLAAGNFLAGGPAGTINVPAAIANASPLWLSKAHGLVQDDQVILNVGVGGTIPTSFAAATIYFVIATGLTTDAFELSATLGGGAISAGSAGAVEARKIVPRTLLAGDDYVISSGQYTLTLF